MTDTVFFGGTGGEGGGTTSGGARDAHFWKPPVDPTAISVIIGSISVM